MLIVRFRLRSGGPGSLVLWRQVGHRSRFDDATIVGKKSSDRFQEIQSGTVEPFQAVDIGESGRLHTSTDHLTGMHLAETRECRAGQECVQVTRSLRLVRVRFQILPLFRDRFGQRRAAIRFLHQESTSARRRRTHHYCGAASGAVTSSMMRSITCICGAALVR